MECFVRGAKKLHGMFCLGWQIDVGCFVGGVEKWHERFCPIFISIRMRVNSALCQVGLVISAWWTYIAHYFHKGCQYEVCFIFLKCLVVQQKLEGVMFGSIYIVGLSILFYSTGPNS